MKRLSRLLPFRVMRVGGEPIVLADEVDEHTGSVCFEIILPGGWAFSLGPKQYLYGDYYFERVLVIDRDVREPEHLLDIFTICGYTLRELKAIALSEMLDF